MFTTIEDDAKSTGVRITSVFSNIFNSIKAIINKANRITISDGFKQNLKDDYIELQKFIALLDQGLSKREALEKTKGYMSSGLIKYTEETDVNDIRKKGNAGYITYAKSNEITTLAEDKSLGNVRTLLNEYNSGLADTKKHLTNCGLSQKEFTDAVGKSNKYFANYTSILNGTEAKMGGYVKSLVSAKAKTIGLQVATTALNAVMSLGVSLLISAAVEGIMYVINYEDNLIQKSEEAADKIAEISDGFKNKSQTVADIGKKFAELAQGVDALTGKNVSLTTDEYSEFLNLSNQLAELFPTLSRNYDENGNAIVNLSGDVDTITASLTNLIDIEKQIANQKILEELPDLYKGVKFKSDNYRREIEDKKNKLKTYQSFNNFDNFWSIITSGANNEANVIGSFKLDSNDENTEIYRKILEDSGVNFASIWDTENEEFTIFGSSGDLEQVKKQIQKEYAEVYDTYYAENKILIADIQQLENQNKQIWSSFKSSLITDLQTDSNLYGILSDENQFVVQSLINEIDFSQLNFKSIDGVKKFIDDTILDIFTNSKNGDLKWSLLDAYDLKDSFVSGKISYVEYLDSLKTVKAKFANESDDIKKLISSIFHIDFSSEEVVGSDSEYAVLVSNVKNKLEDQFDSKANELNYSELQIASTLSIPEGTLLTYEELLRMIEEEKNKVEDVEETATDAISRLSTEIGELQSVYSAVQSAIKDCNENGYLSIDSYQKILELGDGYLSLLIDENGQLNLNEEAYKRVMQAKLQELTLNNVTSLLDRILNMKQEEAQAYANAEANYAEADSLMELVQAKYRVALAEAKTIDAKSGDTTYQDAINRSIVETNAWISMMNSAVDGLGQYETASNDASSATNDLTDELKEQKKALEEAKSDIQDLIDLVIDMIKQEKESEKEAFEEKKDHINELIEKQKELLQAKKDEADFDRELADKQNIVAKNTLASSIAELDDSSAGKKYQKEVNDELTDSRNELNEFLSDEEYDIRIEALDKQQEANEEHYDNLIKIIDDYLDDERKLYEDACKEIDNDNGTLYDRLYQYIYRYTTMSEGEFNGLWSNAQRALQVYDNAHTPLFTTMSNLDTAIHNTATKINEVSTSVGENLANSINIAKTSLNEYMEMLNNITSSRWQVDYKGNTYWSYATDDDDAVVEIVEAIGYKDISEKHRLYQGVRQNLYRWTPPAYAQGTTSATGGISMVGENGAELRILNQGDGIIPAEITRNLMNMGVNPTEFFNKLAKENLWSTSSSDNVFDKILQDVNVEIKPSITVHSPIHIAGDATQSTVEALKRQTRNVAKLAAKEVMNAALQYSSVPRKY